MPGELRSTEEAVEAESERLLKQGMLALALQSPPPRLRISNGELRKNESSFALTLADEILSFAEGEAKELHEEIRLAARGESKRLTLNSRARLPTRAELRALAEHFAADGPTVEAAALVHRELLPLQVELFGYTEKSLFDSHRCIHDGGALQLLETGDFKKLLTSAFGTYRKDLAKAALATSEARFWYAAAAAGSMPLDWLIDYLRTGPEPEESLTNFGGLKRLFSCLSPGDARRVLRHPDPLLEDAVEMLQDYEEAPRLLAEAPKIKSTRGLHDLLLTLEQGESQCEYAREPAMELFSELLSSELQKPTRVLHSAAEAATVGAKLHNCAATKHNRRRCQAGELFLLILHDEQEEPCVLMAFNRELKLLELKRAYNAEDFELEARVTSLLPRLRERVARNFPISG